MKKFLMFFSLSLLFFLINACEKNENEKNESKTKISANFDNESHNMGKNCMSCHTSGGNGEGWFNIAGTVYNENLTTTYPNKRVNLYTQPNGGGTLKYSLEVDAKGNFYSTETIDFGSGLYPSAVGSTTTKYMGSSTTTGQCSSCHGVSNDRIWTK